MSGLRTINLRTGEDSAVNGGGGSGSGQIPANVVTQQMIFDGNGKIKSELIDASISPEGCVKEDELFDSSTGKIKAELLEISIDASTLSSKEDSSNKVTTIDSESTHTQYPTAKAVYDALSQIEGGNSNVQQHIVITKEEFDAIEEKDPNALYVVKNDNSIPSFGGIRVAPTYVCYDNSKDKYIIKESWIEECSDINAIAGESNIMYGSNMSVNDLRYSYYLRSDENIDSVSGYDGSKSWRSMTRNDFLKLFYDRSGSELVCDKSSIKGARYAFIKFEATDDNNYFNPLSGIILFPDDRKISCDREFLVNAFGDSETILDGGDEFSGQVQGPDNTNLLNENCTVSEINDLIDQGCVFIGGYCSASHNTQKQGTWWADYSCISGGDLVIPLDDRLMVIYINDYQVWYDYQPLDNYYYSSHGYSDLGTYYTIRCVSDEIPSNESYDFYNGDKKILSTDDIGTSNDSKTVYLTRAEYDTLIENEEMDPDKFYVVEETKPNFAGLGIAPTQLMWDGEKFMIPTLNDKIEYSSDSGSELLGEPEDGGLRSDGPLSEPSTKLYEYACINSGSIYGKSKNSTYFTEDDLVDSLLDLNAQTIDDAAKPMSFNGFDDWKIPTEEQWLTILDPTKRPGATVNGTENVCFAYIYAREEAGLVEGPAMAPEESNVEDFFGIIIFPDNATIDVDCDIIPNGGDESDAPPVEEPAMAVQGTNPWFATTTSHDVINELIEKGCVYIPAIGLYDMNRNEWAPDGYGALTCLDTVIVFSEDFRIDFDDLNSNIAPIFGVCAPIRLVSKDAVESTYSVYKNGKLIVTSEDHKEIRAELDKKVECEYLSQEEFLNLKEKDPKTIYVVEGSGSNGDTNKTYTIGGVVWAPTQLFWDGEKFTMGFTDPKTGDFYDDCLINSKEMDTFGVENGVTSSYFNLSEIAEQFDSKGANGYYSDWDDNGYRPIDNGGTLISYNGVDDWRLPTTDDIQAAFSTERPGTTLAGVSDPVHFCFIEVCPDNYVEQEPMMSSGQISTDEIFGGNPMNGCLLFPDGVEMECEYVIENIDLSPDEANCVDSLNRTELNEYLSKGCTFLPCISSYNDNKGDWDNHYRIFGDFWFAGYIESGLVEKPQTNNILHFDMWYGLDPDDKSGAQKFVEGDEFYFPVRLVSDSAASASGNSGSSKPSVYLGDILLSGESLTEEGFIFMTKAEYDALEIVNPNKYYVVEDSASGSSTNTIGGVVWAPTQLMWDGDKNTFVIPTMDELIEFENSKPEEQPALSDGMTQDDVDKYNNLYLYSTYNSGGELVGREGGSTFFSYLELASFFDSTGFDEENYRDIDNKNKISFNGSNTWRLPTKEEFSMMFDPTKRQGSTVNGTGNACYTFVNVDFTDEFQDQEPEPAPKSSGMSSETSDDHFGVLIFPDGATIETAEELFINPTNDDFNGGGGSPKSYSGNCPVASTLTSYEIGKLIEQGCVFLPVPYNGIWSIPSVGPMMNAEDLPLGDWNYNLTTMYMSASMDSNINEPYSLELNEYEGFVQYQGMAFDWGMVRLVSEPVGSGAVKVYKAGQVIFDSTGQSGSGNIDPTVIEGLVKDKLDGEILTDEEYETLLDDCKIDFNKIYIVGTKPMPSFGGVSIAPAPLVIGEYTNGAVIGTDADWKENAYNYSTSYTTYFCFDDLAEIFDSEGNQCIVNGSFTRPIDNANTIEYNGFDDWRLPTKNEFDLIVGNVGRPGSLVNGIKIISSSVILTDYNNMFGILLFPDYVTINDNTLPFINGHYIDYATEITTSDLEKFISYGCAFLPALGELDDTDNGLGWDGFNNVLMYGFTGTLNGTAYGTALSKGYVNDCYDQDVDLFDEFFPVRLVSKSAASGDFKIYRGTTPLFGDDFFKTVSTIDNKLNGKILNIDEYAKTSIDNDSIYIVTENVGGLPSFGGIALSPDPLIWNADSSMFEFAEDSSFYSSVDSSFGLVNGSSFFTQDELGKFFDSLKEDYNSSQKSEIDNEGGRIEGYGFSDWRLPTPAEWRTILSLNKYIRNGSTVNGNRGVVGAVIGVTPPGSSSADNRIILLFPDDMIINGPSLDSYVYNGDAHTQWNYTAYTSLSLEDLQSYIDEGCIALTQKGRRYYSSAYDEYRWASSGHVYRSTANNVVMNEDGSFSQTAGSSQKRSIYVDTEPTFKWASVRLVSENACRKMITAYKGEAQLYKYSNKIYPELDCEAPTAKAVYDFVNEKLGNIETLLSQI